MEAAVGGSSAAASKPSEQDPRVTLIRLCADLLPRIAARVIRPSGSRPQIPPVFEVPRFATGLFGLASAALAVVIVGTLLIPIAFALLDAAPAAECITRYGADTLGAEGSCRLVAALRSNFQTSVLVVAAAGGGLAMTGGWLSYRRMPEKRPRRRAFAAGVIGTQAVLLAALIFWFRRGDLETFAYNFLNFTLLEGQLDAFLNGAKNTLFLALVGEAGGLVIALGLCLMSLSQFRSVRAPARVYINFWRGTPMIWQLSFVYFGLALGLKIPLSAYQAAILTFSLHIAAFAAEVLRAGVQSIERGQMDAARGLGFSQFGAMRYAILPQAFRRVIPPLLNEFVGLVKDTSLIVVLGLSASQQDLFTTAQVGYSRTFNATFFVAAAVGYLAVTLPLIRLVNAAERKLRGGLTSALTPG